jgi:hypothetical protein
MLTELPVLLEAWRTRNFLGPRLYGMRDKPAVDYPASKENSIVARADMDSALPVRQSIQAADRLAEELSASNGEGVPQLAMTTCAGKERSICSGSYTVSCIIC